MQTMQQSTVSRQEPNSSRIVTSAVVTIPKANVRRTDPPALNVKCKTTGLSNVRLHVTTQKSLEGPLVAGKTVLDKSKKVPGK